MGWDGDLREASRLSRKLGQASAAHRRVPARGQLLLLVEAHQPRRSALWRRRKPARGRAGPAGAEGRRRLPRRQALSGRRRHLYAGGEQPLPQRGPRLLVRRRLPRPAHRERRDLRHEAISAAHPTLPMPSYVRVTNVSTRKSLIVRVNDRGPYHAQPRDRRVGEGSRAARLPPSRDGARARRICRPGAAARAPTTATWWRRCATARPRRAPVVMVASNRFLPNFGRAPAIRSGAPLPQERPYDLGEGADRVAEAYPRRVERRDDAACERSARAASGRPALRRHLARHRAAAGDGRTPAGPGSARDARSRDIRESCGRPMGAAGTVGVAGRRLCAGPPGRRTCERTRPLLSAFSR